MHSWSFMSKSLRPLSQEKIVEQVAISYSRGPSWPTDQTCVSCIPCIGRQILYHQCHPGSQSLQGSPCTRPCCYCCCYVAAVVSDSVWAHRRQPTRLPRPWDSPGKNTGVGCHFLLQHMKVKSESEVAQSCPTPRDPMDCSLSGSSTMGFSRQEYWSGVPSPSPGVLLAWGIFSRSISVPSLKESEPRVRRSSYALSDSATPQPVMGSSNCCCNVTKLTFGRHFLSARPWC